MEHPQNLRVIILCGGQGTRLREETEYRPKPLVEVGGRPILWHIMKTYAHYGFRDFVLCLGYRGHMLKEYFLNYEAMNNDFTMCLGSQSRIEYHGAHDEQNFRVTLVDTGLETMTGGRLKRVADHIGGDTFLLTYGDGLSDVNILDTVAFHRGHGRIATLTAVRPLSRYGVVELGETGEVDKFSEKPVVEGWINAGFFIFERKVLDYVSSDKCVLETEILNQLAYEQQLMAYRHQGFFFAMDTYREYLHLNELWAANQAPWKVWNTPGSLA